MDAISLGPVSGLGMVAAQSPVGKENSEAEFTKIFYRELLREMFASSDEENPLLPSSVNKDVFIDTLAEKMVKDNLVPLGIR
jgi:hypothetical protein